VDLSETSDLQPSEHWYFLHKLEWLIHSINKYSLNPSTSIDIGAGIGFFSKELKEIYPSLVPNCVDTNYLDSDLGETGGVFFTTEYKVENSADMVLMMDVLEHVESDEQLIRAYLSSATKNATWLITVPAFQSLWSGHDVALGHFRRYRKKQLLTILEKLDFEVMDIRYLFTPIFIPLWILRKSKQNQKIHNDLQKQSRLVNLLALKILRIDLTVLNQNLPGSTLAVVAKMRSRNE
jgi:2-polyprenyl-3-methyl-5-hydroxy-6-metoxy-1,4-benzoquinol methylase